MVTLAVLFFLYQEFDKPWEPVPDCKIVRMQKRQIEEFKPHLFIPLAAIKLYQTVFSKRLGESCNFEPSCSQFAYQAIKKYGLQGLIMTFDRLERCNFFAWQYVNKYYNLNQTENRCLKLYDPPDQNIILGRCR